MGDPTEIVASARCVVYPAEGQCAMDDSLRVHPECAVAALEAAGAFMPAKAKAAMEAAERAMADLASAPRVAESVLRLVLDPEPADHYSFLVGDVWDVDCRVELEPEQVEYLRSLGLRDA